MMNNELIPYKEYFETGLDLIERLPSNWRVAKSSVLFREIVDTGYSELELLSILQNRGIVKQSSTGRKIRKAEENQSYKKICKGDIGYNLMNAFMGAIGASKYEGIISPAYAVCRPRVELNVWYYHYLFRTDLYKTEFNKNSYGIMYERNRLYFDRFKNIYAILPPRSEQDKIVKYLDYKIVKINKFIKAKKKQIERLRELIDYHTNKCINDSNTTWSRFSSVVDLVNEEIERNSHEKYTPIGLYNRGRGIFHKKEVAGSELGDSTFYKVDNDTLIFSGQFAWEGAVAYSNIENIGCIASHRYPMLRGKSNICTSRYLWAFFITEYGGNLINQHSRGAAGRNRPLNIRTLLKEKIAIPNIEDQQLINKLVDKYRQFVEEFNKEHKLLLEYRNSLISNVVTGKVDIRNIDIEEIDQESIGEFDSNNENEDVEEFMGEGGDE